MIDAATRQQLRARAMAATLARIERGILVVLATLVWAVVFVALALGYLECFVNSGCSWSTLASTTTLVALDALEGE